MKKKKLINNNLIIGPMFAGKTTKLIRIINYFLKKNKKILVFKPEIDNRKKANYIVCHNNSIFSIVNVVSNSQQILNEFKKNKNVDVIFFSEVQFFDENFIEIIKIIMTYKKKLFFSGLSFDFEKKKFKIIEDLKKIVDKVYYRYAGCYKCFKKASFSKRLIKEKSVILIGGEKFYSPACENCYK